MFYKGYVIGASFSRGLALHFYDRVKHNKECNYNCNYIEHLFNYKNSFSFITNEKLNISWPIIANQPTFFDEIDWVSEQIQNETKEDYLKTKLVIIQLSNPQRNFIFEGNMYKVSFESDESLKQSVDDILKHKSIFFANRFYNAIDIFLKDDAKFSEENWEFIIDKLNTFIESNLDKNVITKIISFNHDYSELQYLNQIIDNSLIKIKYNDIEYDCVSNFVSKNKLRVKDDLNIDDDHPNFEAHKIVAEAVYDSIKKHKLYWNYWEDNKVI